MARFQRMCFRMSFWRRGPFKKRQYGHYGFRKDMQQSTVISVHFSSYSFELIQFIDLRAMDSSVMDMTANMKHATLNNASMYHA